MINAIVQGVSLAASVAGKVGGDIVKSKSLQQAQRDMKNFGGRKGLTTKVSGSYTGKGLVDTLSGNKSFFD